MLPHALLVLLLDLLLFLPLVISDDVRSHELTIHRDIHTRRCTIVRARRIPRYRRLGGEHHPFGFSRILFIGDRDRAVEQVTVFATDMTSLQDHFSQICPDVDNTLAEVLPTATTSASQQHPFTLLANASEDLGPPEGVVPLELTEITVPGPSSNRVDITFFSDGYRVSESDKFISDVTWLVKEISANQTFHSVAPLLNFWAAFTPSEESGVGVGGVPKNTPFGLYRDGTELRGLYYAKPKVARDACNSLGDRCDYGVLVGNDPLYGGIGGEFVTITPSTVNGALVLRHELGHSIIGVGEEYDGGFAYFGPNSAHDAQRLPWAHWLIPTPNGSSSPRVERSIMPFQAYPWTILNTTAPWRAVFHSSGTYARHLIRFSLSGLPAARQLSVRLDDEDLSWVPLPGIGIDRWHYDIHRPDALSGGEHEIVFELLDAEQEGIAQLCRIEILEYGTEDEFDARPGVYGVFPTFSIDNETTYRPTNEDCLMRLTVSPHFCDACAEALWLTLLARVDLFEEPGLDVDCSQLHTTIRTNLIPFGDGEREHPYRIQWTFDGNVMDNYANRTELVLTGDARGEVAVHIRLNKPEVRVDPGKLLSSEKRVWLSGMCSDTNVEIV